MTDRIKLALFALTAAYIALLPQFYHFFNQLTRFTLLWSWSDYAAIVTSVAVLAAVLGIGYVVVYVVWSPPRALRMGRDAVLIVVLAGVLSRSLVSILDRSDGTPAISEVLDTGWAKAIYYLALPALFMALNAQATKRALRSVYALLVPMMGMGLAWPLAFETYDVKEPPVPPQLVAQLAATPTPGTTNVFIFMMDEWSYAQTFPAGRMIEPMPHLGELLGHATLYRNARSPGPKTAISIPRFLFQNNADYRKLSYKQVFASTLTSAAVPGATLFSESPRDWYRIAIGFWIDYRGMLGTNVDFAIKTQSDAGLRTYRIHTLSLLKSQVGGLRHLGLISKRPAIEPSLSWVFGTEQTHRWALATTAHMNQPTFAYFHYCLPHYPYVWDARGKKNPFPAPPMKHTVETYRDNIFYLDTVVGEIVASLRKAGKYDSSMLILTSDHAWRYDPEHPHAKMEVEDADPKSELRHVPLIVKYPGQSAGEVVDDAVSTTDVHQMIRAGLAGRQWSVVGGL